jgi:hypothetical protein
MNRQTLKYALLLCATITLFVAVSLNAQQGLPKRGADFTTFMTKGIWTWYGEPKAVDYKGKTYVSYFRILTNPGNVEVASYDHATGKIDTFVLKAGFGYDDHNHPSIVVRPDGRLLALYCMHYDASMKMRISANPEDITGWGPEKIAFSANCTYPNIIQLSGEGVNGNRIFVFYRGLNDQPTFVYSDDGGNSWSSQVKIFTGGSRPYCKFDSDGKNTIHMIIERDNRNNGPQPAFYLCYKNGAFYKADGTLVKTLDQVKTAPITTTEAEMVYNPAAPALDSFPTLTNVGGTCWDVGIQPDGNPVFLFDNFFNNAAGLNHLYHYYRYTGKAWQRTYLVNSFDGMGGEAGFGGGLTLDHANVNIVYLSRQVTRGTPHELDRWVTSDGGKSWIATPMTRNSAEKNTRPCVPRGFRSGNVGVIWMYGSYENWFGPFSTDVKMYAFNTQTITAVASKSDRRPIVRNVKGGVAITLADPERSSLALYSLQGRKIVDLTPAVRAMRKGEAMVAWRSTGVSRGTYVVEFDNGETKQQLTCANLQ